MEFETIENATTGASGGAGIQSAQLIAGKGVKVILTGNVGPNAFQALQAAGISIITGVNGSVKDAIDLYSKGGITPDNEPMVPSHFGSK
jgi:predicted Fe-Mo cluster-binding NifX family protein